VAPAQRLTNPVNRTESYPPAPPLSCASLDPPNRSYLVLAGAALILRPQSGARLAPLPLSLNATIVCFLWPSRFVEAGNRLPSGPE